MTKYKPIPEFNQFVEYVTQGDLVDGEYQVVVNRVPLPEQPIIEAAETLKSGYQHVDTLGRLPTIEGEELDGVKVKLSESYHDDIVTEATKTTNPINITGTVADVKGFPEWRVGEIITSEMMELGDVVRFYPPTKNLYKCFQPHKTQADWTPDITMALWVKYFTPEMGYQPWEQPIGSTNYYIMGAKVTHKGHLWESTYAVNVWEPGVFGWLDLGIYP